MSGLRDNVENFLYRDAQLLDSFEFAKWLELFTPDAEYQVAPLDVRSLAPERALYLVDDDYTRLRSRIEQLLSGKTFSEAPFSRTRRSITNILIEEQTAGILKVYANFIVNRFRHGNVDTYIGQHELTIVQDGDKLRYRKRKCVLDNEALRPQGKLSILL